METKLLLKTSEDNVAYATLKVPFRDDFGHKWFEKGMRMRITGFKPENSMCQISWWPTGKKYWCAASDLEDFEFPEPK